MTVQIPLDPMLTAPIEEDMITKVKRFSDSASRYFQQLTRAVNNYLGATTAQVIIPLSADVITINPTAATVYLKPAGAIGSLSIIFPLKPQDGLDVTIKTTQTITTLTLTATTPNTILDPITTLAANGYVVYRFILSQNIWIRIG